MTLPNERYRSLVQAKNFLRDLMDPKKTPRVPRAIRREAYWRLKHYPTDYELEQLAKNSPKILDATEFLEADSRGKMPYLGYGEQSTKKLEYEVTAKWTNPFDKKNLKKTLKKFGEFLKKESK